METKLSKFKTMLKEAKSKNEKLLVDFFELFLYDLITNNVESDSSFDAVLETFIVNRVKGVNKTYKKKETKVIEQEIYLLSLLSFTFLNGKIKFILEENKVMINKGE